MRKALISWSTGKDSALALYKVIKGQQYEVVGLLTCITDGFNRVSIHGTHLDLLTAQAAALDLPIYPINIPYDCTMEQYQSALQISLKHAKEQGIDAIIFGDIFLVDVRRFREEQLAVHGMEAVFPLWNIDTYQLSRIILGNGFKAIVSSVDKSFLTDDYVGREYNKKFLQSLPESVDPCGENGEFHTFVYSGPIFRHNLPVKVTAKVSRAHAYYADIQLR